MGVCRGNQGHVYIGGLPLERAHPTYHEFPGLPRDVNVSLVFYRLYKFFQPWPMPTMLVDWNEHQEQGRVIRVGETGLHLQPIGQAEAWVGIDYAVLWEAYLRETSRRGDWQVTLAQSWKAVEKDLRVKKIFTPPHEPAFPHGYLEFLTHLGYARDLGNPEWWSKDMRLK